MVTTSPSGQRLVIRRNGRQRTAFGTGKVFIFGGAVGITNPDGSVTETVFFQLLDGHTYGYVLPPLSAFYTNLYGSALALVPPSPNPPFFGGYLWSITTPMILADKKFIV